MIFSIYISKMKIKSCIYYDWFKHHVFILYPRTLHIPYYATANEPSNGIVTFLLCSTIIPCCGIYLPSWELLSHWHYDCKHKLDRIIFYNHICAPGYNCNGTLSISHALKHLRTTVIFNLNCRMHKTHGFSQ